ncbi:MAG TPA: Fur family transcriptional regulator [Vicinamibacterales bacterium]|nr:Fur family transcriptional regulator [Vicinamibacterales bacterium]
MGSDPAELLRQRGIHVTAQRLAVLRAVACQPHIAAEGVLEVVRSEIGAISLQSVYDALAVLTGAGLIRRIQPAGSPARFEDRVGDNHHHLICRACGRMTDVACAVGAGPCLEAVDSMGYEVEEAEVIYWGRCPECLARDRASKPGPAAQQRPRSVSQTVTSHHERTSSTWTRKKKLPSRAEPPEDDRTGTGGRTS